MHFLVSTRVITVLILAPKFPYFLYPWISFCTCCNLFSTFSFRVVEFFLRFLFLLSAAVHCCSLPHIQIVGFRWNYVSGKIKLLYHSAVCWPSIIKLKYLTVKLTQICWHFPTKVKPAYKKVRAFLCPTERKCSLE